MHWHASFLARLAEEPCCGYRAGQRAATEPTALATLALLANGRQQEAVPGLEWLAAQQADDGSVGVREGEPEPRWPTSLAVLAWSGASSRGMGSWLGNVDAALAWIYRARGNTKPRSSEVGHDSMLEAWPWVDGTHSWIEPTALHVLALKATGRARHDRVREAVRLLLDRQLPGGGCNYGNTYVLGQKLRPHVQPTGLAMLALVGERDGRGRIQRSLEYLLRSVRRRMTPLSMAWALLGLAAHQRLPAPAERWLDDLMQEGLSDRRRTPHERALMVLAGTQCRDPDQPVLFTTLPQRVN